MQSDISTIDTILLDIDVKNKEDLFNKVSKKAKELNIVEDDAEIVKKFLEKEKDTETYLGYMCSIPHIKTSKVAVNKIFFVRLNNVLNWADKDYVKYIFLILTNDYNIHLKALKTVSKIILKNDILNLFKNSEDRNIISEKINEIIKL